MARPMALPVPYAHQIVPLSPFAEMELCSLASNVTKEKITGGPIAAALKIAKFVLSAETGIRTRENVGVPAAQSPFLRY